MSTETLGLSAELQNYLLSVSVKPDKLYERLCIETQTLVGFNMQISPEQAQFMTVLMKIMSVGKALEVGTFTGYSALTIARALPQDGRLVACDISTEWTSVAKKYWEEAGVADKIDLRIAPATDTLDALIENGESGSFDFAFIDADKQNYTAYYEKSLQLLRPGGVVGIDNTLWGGSVADPAKTDADTVAIRQVNQLIYNDNRVTASLVPIGDGFHLAYKL